MASAATVNLSTAPHAAYITPTLSEQSAEEGTRVLQENHDQFDIFFNDSGFHNHIAHHIVTIFALGASPAEIKSRYSENASYQRQRPADDPAVTKSLYDAEVFQQKLGDPKLYSAYMALFSEEMERKGWQEVLQEYVFKGDERANNLFNRLFAGFLHPIIHLGFGVEFEQPAIIAEALAQASVHPGWLNTFLMEADKLAQARDPAECKSLAELLEDIRADHKLSTAAEWGDENKIRDGILVRGNEEMLKYASQYRVKPENLEEATAETIDISAFIVGAAQRRDKQINFDFYYMHLLTASIFFAVFVAKPWISVENKVKLVEWKGRIDLCMYASRRSPELLVDEITSYKPKQAQADAGDGDGWDPIFRRAVDFKDDGHTAKFIRALAHGQKYCAPYEGGKSFPIKGGMWLQLGNMVIDSVEATGATWIRSAGFDEAWADMPSR